MPRCVAVSWDQFTPEALAAMALAGDDGAMEALWERFRPLALRLLGRYAGQAISEDLPGALFMAFHGLVLRYDPSRGVTFAGYLKSWLRLELQAAAERARNSQWCGVLTQAPGDGDSQGAKLFTDGETDSEEHAAPGDMEQSVIRRLMVARLLARLPRRERYAVWQHVVEGWTHREVGAAVGISEGDVRLVYHRARTKLARWCKENPDDAV